MKIVCIKAKQITSIISLFLVVSLLVLTTSVTKVSGVYLGYATRLVPIYNVQTDQKKVALTFDAAWGSDKTSRIIEILKENGLEATFFLVGFWVEANADKVKEIDAAGFDIGTHSNTHPKMSTLSTNQITNELTTSINLITNITGKPVRFFRPPFGDYNNNVLNTASDLGLQTIQWDVDSLDWKGLSATEILSRVKQSVTSGSIILFHNNSDHIIEALPLVIDYLKQQQYSMVKLSDLVYQADYSINNNGLQIKN